MHIVVVGMNHRTANVELRERVSLSEQSLDHVLTQLRDSRTVMESVVLSTCNRTEIYALVSSVRAGHDYLHSILATHSDLNKTTVIEHTYALQGEAAVTHAMRVASGLDSVVIGETQILGQMRTAFQAAFEAGNTGALFNRLFREVIHIGKRAQSETSVGQNPVSVSYAAVHLASKVLGDMKSKHALVIGAGHMGALAMQHLAAQGVGMLSIANRTRAKAEAVAQTMSANVVAYEDIPKMLEQVDLIISATSFSGYTIRQADLSNSERIRRHMLVMLDIAMPRDLDPGLSEIPGVYLYDVDDLEGVVDANLRERERQAAVVETMIRESVEDFSKWLAEQEVVPLITALRAKGQSIQSDVMESLLHKLPDLTERDKKILSKHMMSVVNQLLRDPIQNVKELAIASGDSEYVSMFAQLFGIDVETTSDNKTAEALHASGENRSFVELFQRLRGATIAENERILHPVLR